MTGHTRHPASFRDPSGFIFHSSSILYRQVNKNYAPQYRQFMDSGLYDDLVQKKWIVPHQEVTENLLENKDWYITLQPERIPFWSYPYEWCFEQLKDAALLTLEITLHALEKGMILKDATPYNIQFPRGFPVFIDTLSFENYDASQPWIAYRQFCENFLYPLWLSHYLKQDCHRLFYAYPEGIPAPDADRFMPWKSRLKPATWLHLHLAARLQLSPGHVKNKMGFSRKKLQNILTHLHSIITKLENRTPSSWLPYYRESASEDYIQEKEKIVTEMLQQIEGTHLLDLGANEGYFSLRAAEKNFSVIAVDSDEQCINTLYRKIRQDAVSRILPLCMDITNPTSASGWANKERISFEERLQVQAVLALALVHHLHIGKNIPLGHIADYFSHLAPQLIIEFVPKEDIKVIPLLRYKKDTYSDYTKEFFEKEFSKYYTIQSERVVPGSLRRLYLMKKR